jgi:hypothetical protein
MLEAEESCPPDMRTCHRAGHKRDVGALLERNDWASVRRIPSTLFAALSRNITEFKAVLGALPPQAMQEGCGVARS